MILCRTLATPAPSRPSINSTCSAEPKGFLSGVTVCASKYLEVVRRTHHPKRSSRSNMPHKPRHLSRKLPGRLQQEHQPRQSCSNKGQDHLWSQNSS